MTTSRGKSWIEEGISWSLTRTKEGGVRVCVSREFLFPAREPEGVIRSREIWCVIDIPESDLDNPPEVKKKVTGIMRHCGAIDEVCQTVAQWHIEVSENIAESLEAV